MPQVMRAGGNSTSFLTVAAFWCLLILRLLLVPAWCDSWGNQFGLWAQDSADALPNVLIAPPGEFRRQMQWMKDAVQEANYRTAGMHLDRLFASVAVQDYVLVERDEPLAAGAKDALWRAVGTLPKQVLEEYEKLVGADAASRLKASTRNTQVQHLEQVADRWFATKAGVEARLVLARIHLDEGRPREALSSLSPLAHLPFISMQYEPEVSLLQSCAYLLTGQPQHARATLERLSVEHPQATLRIADRQFDLSDPDADVFTALARAVEPHAGSNSTSSEDWLLHRGNMQRNALGHNGVPPLRLWAVPCCGTDALRDVIGTLQEQLVAADIPTVPSLSPIGIGEQVVFRTIAECRAVDSTDGRTLWRFSLNPTAAAGRTDLAALNPADSTDAIVLRQRIWEDSVRGQLSSDGRRAFLIDEVTPPKTQPAGNLVPFLLGQNRFPEQPPPTNQLVALDLERQGSFLWMVGDRSGEAEPALAGAFFLGPPLPVGNHLFVIAQLDFQLLLLKLDAATGRQIWRFPLAQLETKATRNGSPHLQMGATPSYSDGVLVCPTNAGAVVAVDAATRRYLWAHRYASLVPPQVIRQNADPSHIGRRWMDFSAVIVQDRVLITPLHGELQCLDRGSGRLLWRRRRSDLLFVAASFGDNVLLVGKNRVTAVRMTDGTDAWSAAPYVAIPAGGMPGGTGFLDGRYYYLPTTDPELLQIDLPSGRIVRHHPTDEALGNLICCHGRVVSQGPLTLMAFGESADETPRVKEREAAERVSAAYLAKATLEELVAGLHRDDFPSREAASQELLRRGGDAVEILAAAAKQADPEVVYRSTALLIHLLDGSDADGAFRARQALVQSRNSDVPGSFAARALAREVRRRAPVAREKLQELGATMDEEGKKVTLGSRWKGGNEGLQHLQWLGNLQTLELRNSEINDDGLRCLRGLDGIESLNLSGTGVTNKGLANLAHLAGLKILLLQRTGVDDRATGHLRNLQQLRAINLLETHFTDEGIEKLRAAMPNVQVLY